jgi:hypothetical protein
MVYLTALFIIEGNWKIPNYYDIKLQDISIMEYYITIKMDMIESFMREKIIMSYCEA